MNPAPGGANQLVDLRRLNARILESLLAEETAAWLEALEWDYGKSAGLVRRFVDLRALRGAALIERGQAIGYVYYVLEENKGLVGDLYVRQSPRAADRESALLHWALEALTADSAIGRVEAQLMMLRSEPRRHLPLADHLKVYERNFMRVDLTGAPPAEGRVRKLSYFERWSDLYQDSAAQLIAAAYAGHIDSSINDQYCSAAGARRFLHNIVQYPGCGTFYRPASYLAFDATNGSLCGISLTSLVGPRSGHVTQICVSPAMRGAGIGRELLRQSLLALRGLGCRSASLTVTASNHNAVGLYERMGFQTVKRFSAYVWEGF